MSENDKGTNVLETEQTLKADSSSTEPETGDNQSSFSFVGIWESLKQKFTTSSPHIERNREFWEDFRILKTKVENDSKNHEKNPEIAKTAHVRLSKELCDEERIFIAARKARARQSFAKFIGVDVDEINDADIPIIAVTGSGGGMRANVDTMGFVRGMEKSGLWDSVTYFTGVSGACWALATYYTVAEGSVDATIEHFKQAYVIKPSSTKFFQLLFSLENGLDLTFGAIEEKRINKLLTNATDIYGAVLGGYFFRKGNALIPKHFKLSQQAKLLENGANPFPIYTTIRHERPWEDCEEAFEKCAPHNVEDNYQVLSARHEKDLDKKKSSYQWIEFTPYEIGCDDINAWIPSWAFGRYFNKGVSTNNVPERNFALELGYMTCAQCAPIARYVHLADRELPSNWLGNELRSFSSKVGKVLGEHGIDKFESHHPIHPAHEPNPFLLARDKPECGIDTAKHIHVLDSGMDNNHPWYVVTRPEREVDIIITIDGSKETMEPTFFDRMAKQFSTRRGLLWTPVDPPEKVQFPEKLADDMRGKPELIEKTFAPAYAQIFDGKPINDAGKALLGDRDLTLIYMPNIPHKKYPNFDPLHEKVVATSNFVFQPEDIDSIIGVGEACWDDSLEKIRSVIKNVWEKKKSKRLSSVAI
ncbi:12384_t:CDS:10 [Ambispora gerdemannii]|uniref:Lysophospholipase n=1 Tax=Ambispora gerdemannii TaxID=144530 RepID=A0A9N8YKJ2_9GLOM|nr:12384_t:CDS:10 [Ambispora gerdemannii]